MRKHPHEQGFIGLALLIAVVLIAVGVLAFVALRKQPASNSSGQSNANQGQQSSNNGGSIVLTGTVKQGPGKPVCSAYGSDCYRPVANYIVQAVGNDGKVAGSTKTDGNGKYSMQLNPGHYVLELVPQVDVYHITNNEINLSANDHQLDIILDTAIR